MGITTATVASSTLGRMVVDPGVAHASTQVTPVALTVRRYRVGGALVHTLARHTSMPGHTVPQAPQFALSVCSLTQVPLQLASPLWQVSVQVPAEHTWPGPQAFPQAPQFATLVSGLISQPFAAIKSQS